MEGNMSLGLERNVDEVPAGHSQWRILIADDHPIVRAGVRAELARHADIEVIGEATNGDEAAQQTEALQPDVLVLDIEMPGLKATEVIRRASVLPQPVHVLILTAHDDIDNVHGMLEAGATGYLLKDEAPEVIADAIRAVARGGTWLSDEIAQKWARYTVEEAQEATRAKLSEREMEVLQLVATGQTNRQIGVTLHISEKAVQKRLSGVYQKLGVTSRVEAVMAAMRQGLLETKP
jgi:DNA-binding NarL/FixJ family response regulator